MNADRVRDLAYQLRLYGVHAAFARRAEQAVAEQQHPLDFLHLLLEDEALSRKDRFGKTLLGRARFRRNVDLEDWDSSYDRGLPKQKFRELAALGFWQNKENLLLFGKTGEGKTHLAVALGRRLCLEGVQTLFLPVNYLFEEVAASKAAGKYLALAKHLSKAKVLVLDDFGLRSYSHDEATVLVDLLEERCRKGIVIVTSQVDDKGWKRLFEDEVIAEAVVDRITHPSQKLVLKGGSYRDRLTAKG